MRKLETVQKENKLNEIYATDVVGEDKTNHQYLVVKEGKMTYDLNAVVGEIQFQKGPRNDKNSINGVLLVDILEIAKDVLFSYQQGPYNCDENAEALNHIEKALECLNNRTKDRAARNVLGKYEK